MRKCVGQRLDHEALGLHEFLFCHDQAFGAALAHATRAPVATHEKAEAIRRVRKAARKQVQRDGLIPMPKHREDAAVLLRGPGRFEIPAQTRWN